MLSRTPNRRHSPRGGPVARLLVGLLAAVMLAGCATISVARPSPREPLESGRAPASGNPDATPLTTATREPSDEPSAVGASATPEESGPGAPPSRPPDLRPAPGSSGGLSSLPTPLATPFVVPTTFGPALSAKLQRIIDRSREGTPVPGLSVAVRLPSGETWAGVSGLAAIEPPEPVTTETVFGIASVTKTFVAALIMQLAEEDRLSLDDRLSRFLPDAPRADRVTLRMLLSHRSGIFNYFESPRYNRKVFADPAHRWTYDEIMALVGKPYCRPDTCYHYSNTGYVLLGRVAEVAAGAPLPRLLRERFFEPLGMDHTFFQPDDPTPADAAHGYLAFSGGFVDYTRRSRVIPMMSAATVAWAAGAIASTPTDLARWAAALYGGEILAPESVAAMEAVLPPDGYGLGTRAERFHGHRAFGHRGGIRGFESSMFYFPDEGVAIALLSNRGLWLTDKPLKLVVQAVLGPSTRTAG